MSERAESGIVRTSGYGHGPTAAAFTPVVSFSPLVPPEIIAIVEPVLAERLWMVPTWCQEIVVKFDPSMDGGDAAHIEPRTEYRKAMMGIGPAFIVDTVGGREDILTHELAHLIIAPLHSWCSVVMEHSPYEEDSPSQGMLEEHFRLALESTTEDLMRVLQEKHRTAADAR